MHAGAHLQPLRVPSRWGTQTPFTNLTFDWTCPDDLADEAPPYWRRKLCDFTYGDLAPEMAVINRAFMEVMTAGDADEAHSPSPSPPTTLPRTSTGTPPTPTSCSP